MESKQVLVMKKFGKGLRTGKYCAQAGHASTGALLSISRMSKDGKSLEIPLDDPFVRSWVTERFKKVAVYVETDQELGEIYQKARAAGLPVALIKDAGLTEFNEPTLTAVGIGPADPKLIDKITGSLPLF